MTIGLRVDVDTFRGTTYGVPNLCRLFTDHRIKTSFFFSVGPDNMGRHLFRLLRPRFLGKMLRSRAASLYGWDILLRGTLWPGPVIGEKRATVIRAASDAGHEIGLHAWDHHAWQMHIDAMTRNDIYASLKKGVDLLTRITGRPPTCSAVPGWRCNGRVLEEKLKFPFVYNSDCRGKSIFRPVIHGKGLPQPQVPVTLPTYDEVIGRNGITADTYNDYILSLIKPENLNVLTIHAEVEGISLVSMFDRFLRAVQKKGMSFVPLGKLVADTPFVDPGVIIVAREIPGRDDWVSCQADASCL